MTTSPILLNTSQDYSFSHHKTAACAVGIHLHDSYEIFQALCDNIQYFVEGSLYLLRKGDIIITNTTELHYPQKSDDTPYERRFIQFKPSAFLPFFNTDYNPLALFDQRKVGSLNLLTLHQLPSHPIHQLLDSLEKNSVHEDSIHRLSQKIMLIDLFIQLDQAYSQNSEANNQSTPMDPRIFDVLTYINQHYHEALNLDQIAKTLFIDKYYLSHLFKKNTGFTLYSYIQSKRIQLAKQLLTSQIDIQCIPTQCGFNDYSNFYKTFKQLTGVSPNHYKHNL